MPELKKEVFGFGRELARRGLKLSMRPSLIEVYDQYDEVVISVDFGKNDMDVYHLIVRETGYAGTEFLLTKEHFDVLFNIFFGAYSGTRETWA